MKKFLEAMIPMALAILAGGIAQAENKPSTNLPSEVR
jgi:hypothetical protein